MKKQLLSIALLCSVSQANVTFDSGTSLLWQDNKSVKENIYTHAKAQEFCANLEIKEHSEFRLPTIRELHTIVDYNNHNPVILNGFKHVASENFWTSTPYVYSNGTYWTIDFKKGTSKPIGERYSKNVRCVQRIN